MLKRKTVTVVGTIALWLMLNPLSSWPARAQNELRPAAAQKELRPAAAPSKAGQEQIPAHSGVSIKPRKPVKPVHLHSHQPRAAGFLDPDDPESQPLTRYQRSQQPKDTEDPVGVAFSVLG